MLGIPLGCDLDLTCAILVRLAPYLPVFLDPFNALVGGVLELPNQSLQLTQRPTPLLGCKPLKPLAVDALGRRWWCCRGLLLCCWRGRWCSWTLSSSLDLHVRTSACVSRRVSAHGACACGPLSWRRSPLRPHLRRVLVRPQRRVHADTDACTQEGFLTQVCLLIGNLLEQVAN